MKFQIMHCSIFIKMSSSKISSIILLCLFAFSNALDESRLPEDRSISAFARAQIRLKAEARIEEINKSQQKWTAKLNPRFAEMTETELRTMLGVPLDGSTKFSQSNLMQKPKTMMGLNEWRETMMMDERKFKGENDSELPKEFNVLQKWPECRQIVAKIQDQSSCGSCWAVSSASVIQDRICIASGGKQKVEVSAQDVNSCTSEMTGCNGGFPQWAFEYWRSQGVCSGSKYTDEPRPEYGCKPYPFPPSSRIMFPTPRCERECENPEYDIRYNEDRHYGNRTFHLVKATEDDIKMAIMQGGSVVASMVTYSDFHHYHSGVYEHSRTARQMGGHAVRMIGWGEERGTPYWLIANSWNTDWGQQGLFKIVRGKDECKIESWGITFGEPDLK